MNSSTTIQPSQADHLVELIDHLKGIQAKLCSVMELDAKLDREDPIQIPHSSYDPNWKDKSPRYRLFARWGENLFLVMDDLNAAQANDFMTLVNYDLEHMDGVTWAALPVGWPIGQHWSID